MHFETLDCILTFLNAKNYIFVDLSRLLLLLLHSFLSTQGLQQDYYSF